ncbi:MAG: ABC transporter substrate-binding protein [Deltaproteobacteria bacterium]|nr:ABC transporter substrate-binding protein [Deltaproteobacteria bacterium]
MQKRILLTLLAALLLAFSGTLSSFAQEKKVVRVGFASVSWDTQLPIRVAKARGFFKSQGLSVEHVFIRGGATVLAAMVSGDLDFADMGAQAPIRARSQGLNIYIIGVWRDKVTYALVGDKNTRTIADLRGKVIGTTGPGSLSEFVVRTFLKRNQMDPDKDVTLRAVGGTAVRTAALENRLIAAAPFTAGETVELLRKGFPLIINLAEALDIPHTVIAARGNSLDRYPETTKRFLKGAIMGLQFVKRNKQEAIKTGFEAGLTGNPDMVSRAYNLYAPAYTSDLSIPRKGIQAMIEEDIRTGVIDGTMTVEKVVQEEILKKAQEELR